MTGLPGSGKTSLAAPLAPALGIPCLSKDTIKEALWDCLGPGDRAWGTVLGRAASVALESLAGSVPGAVIDHFVHADNTAQWSTLPNVVEVRCACATDVSRRRYGERRRHPCHFDAEQLIDAYDRWVDDDARRPPVGPRLDVDTARAVDIDAIVRWVRRAWAPPAQ